MNRRFPSLCGFIVAACMLVSCNDMPLPFTKSVNPDALSEYADPAYRINANTIRQDISLLMQQDKSELSPDKHARAYYHAEKPLLWVSFMGAEPQCDILVDELKTLEQQSINPQHFYLQELQQDLSRARRLEVDSADHQLNMLLARIEYRLTKALFRLATGQQFGFTHPRYIFNHLDKNEQDSTGRTYRGLFDIPLKQPTESFYHTVVQNTHRDSLPLFLQRIQPADSIYWALVHKLRSSHLTEEMRHKVLANMERCRWQVTDDPRKQAKHILVNLPSFMLKAIDKDEVLTMKIGCGTMSTKTPLLTSRIKYMELNPKWIIPQSIIKTEVARHAGDSAWFARHRYTIKERSSGNKKEVWEVSSEMFRSGNYSVAQEGGSGNSLGRIVFRFDNAFAVYLHHTSSPGFFARDHRGVSHGCIRVEQPFDLARFVLTDKDPVLLDKIQYSLTADISSLSERAKELGIKDPKLDKKRLVGYVPVSNPVPLYIAYYTLYPATQSVTSTTPLVSFPDIYGYDSVLYNNLQTLGVVSRKQH